MSTFFGNMLCFSNQVPAKLISLPWPVCFFKSEVYVENFENFPELIFFWRNMCETAGGAEGGGELVFRILLS